MSLSTLLKDQATTAAMISDHLNGLSDHEQVGEVRSLSIKQVHRCWALFEPGETINLEYLVPEHLGASVPVHHLGITLPMGRFEKRFVRAPDMPGELWGYNHQSLAWLTGPGSFVVHEAGSENHDALFIDYRRSRVAKSRDGLRPNRIWGTLSYGGMRDFMRRVSDRVSVGRAFVRGKDLGASFMLVRVDRTPAVDRAL